MPDNEHGSLEWLTHTLTALIVGALTWMARGYVGFRQGMAIARKQDVDTDIAKVSADQRIQHEETRHLIAMLESSFKTAQDQVDAFQLEKIEMYRREARCAAVQAEQAERITLLEAKLSKWEGGGL